MILVLFYALDWTVCFCVIAAGLVIYAGFCALVFVATLVAMIVRGVLRSAWPHDPRWRSLTQRRKPGYDALGRSDPSGVERSTLAVTSAPTKVLQRYSPCRPAL